jgi:uncharacterized protein
MKENQFPNSLDIFITEDCNLDCSYCFVKKNFQKTRLTLPTLKRAIDHFFRFPTKIKSINFTGGEPLLEYPLLKEISLYLLEKAKKEDLRINLSLVTNGTLITKEHCQFFEKNQFTVKISIDGEKRYHDAYRIFRFNPHLSSHHLILNNIKNFNDKSKVAASLVFTPQNVNSLFKNIRFLAKLGFGYIDFYPDMYAFWSKEQLIEFKKQFKKFTNYYISLFLKKKLKSIFKNMLLDFILNERGRFSQKEPSCQKVHLASDGNFYFCDKVFSLPQSERKPYIIGDIKRGIDNRKRLRLLNFFQRRCQRIINPQNNYFFCPIGHYLYFSFKNQDLKRRFSNFLAISKIYLDNLELIKRKLIFNPFFAKLYQ